MAPMKKASILLSLLLVSLLFISSEEMKGVEANTCTAPSRLYRGPCSRDSNCRSVCASEGFPDGDCHGFRRRCLCKRPC